MLSRSIASVVPFGSANAIIGGGTFCDDRFRPRSAESGLGDVMSEVARRRLTASGYAALVVGVLVAGLALALTLMSIVDAPRILAGDYLTYQAGSSHLLAGQKLYPSWELHGPFLLGDGAWGQGYVYPPTAALLTVPFAMLGTSMGFLAFAEFALIGLWAVVYRIGRQEGLGSRWAAVLATAFCLSGPSIDAVMTGQANAYVAVAVGLAWIAPSMTGYLGFAFALVKLFPGALLVMALRDRAPILKPALLAGLLVIATTAAVGVNAWAEFAKVFQNGLGRPLAFPVAPRQYLESTFGSVPATVLVDVATGVILVASYLVRSRHLAIFLVSLAMILPAPQWYWHYLLILLMGLVPGAARWLSALPSAGGRPWARPGRVPT